MRRLTVLAGCVALAACNGGASEAVDGGGTEPTTTIVMAADGAPPQGRYRAVDEDGVILLEELREDGTYMFTDEDGNAIEEGIFEQKTSEILCFTSEAEGAAEKCYSEQVGEDGVWRTTDPDTGATSVIERIGDE